MCVAAVAVLAAGCTADDTTPRPSPDGTDRPVTSRTPTTGVALGARCTNPQVGYEVAYPAAWETNGGEVLAACSLFDPDPIDVPPDSEIPTAIAVSIRTAATPFADALADEDQLGARLLAREDATVDGRPAAIESVEATEDAPLLEPSTITYRYVVDLGAAAGDGAAAAAVLIAETHGVDGDGDEPDFTARKAILDAMMASLRLPRTAAALADGQMVALGFSKAFTGVGVIDVATGDLVRELTSQIGEGASSLDYVPGKGTVLYSRVVTAATSEVVEVPLSGGDPQVVARGYAVDATDDGARLAIARRRLQEGGGQVVELEVTEGGRPLARWTARDESLQVSAANLAWSPDGQRLAFDVRFEDGTGVFLIDLADAPAEGDLFQVANPVEPGEDRGAFSSRPFWTPDGTFGLVQACCGLVDFDTWSAVLVDPDTAEVTETLFSVDRGVGPVDVATRAPLRLALTLTHDAPGSRGAPGPDVLMHWEAGAQPVAIATELQAGAW